MTKLQMRIATILIGAICLVVAVSTTAAFITITYLAQERMVGPVGSQIEALFTYLARPTGLDHLSQEELEALGPERTDLTAAVEEWLTVRGVDVPVTVLTDPAKGVDVAVVELAGRRIAVEFPGDIQPPRDLWIILGTWLVLVVLGVIAVSLVMAYRVTRPFAVLERAVASVGPDGVLPHVAETGGREARETAHALNKLSDRLRNATESRMRLVAAAGHDFRTPMTRMRLRAEFLGDEERAEWLRDIDELEHIADSAILLVKEEVSRDSAESVAVDQVIREVVDELVAQGQTLSMATIQPVTLHLPPLALKRALRNLLINSATHGRSGQVRLRNENGIVTLDITDKGPGIPPDLLDQVFEPFFRAEPGRLQTVPGAGLGLAIASEIIERCDGKLEISNLPDGGLRQRVTWR